MEDYTFTPYAYFNNYNATPTSARTRIFKDYRYYRGLKSIYIPNNMIGTFTHSDGRELVRTGKYVLTFDRVDGWDDNVVKFFVEDIYRYTRRTGDTSIELNYDPELYEQIREQDPSGQDPGGSSEETPVGSEVVGENIGGGTEIYKERTDNNVLRFRTLGAGTNVTFDTSVEDLITINSLGGGGVGGDLCVGTSYFHCGLELLTERYFHSPHSTHISISTFPNDSTYSDAWHFWTPLMDQPTKILFVVKKYSLADVGTLTYKIYKQSSSTHVLTGTSPAIGTSTGKFETTITTGGLIGTADDVCISVQSTNSVPTGNVLVFYVYFIKTV